MSEQTKEDCASEDSRTSWFNGMISRLSNATPGPWNIGEGYEQNDPGYYIYSESTGRIVVSFDTLSKEDLKFIASARYDIERLVQENTRLRQTLQQYKDECCVCHGKPHNVPIRSSYEVLLECPVCKRAINALSDKE